MVLNIFFFSVVATVLRRYAVCVCICIFALFVSIYCCCRILPIYNIHMSWSLSPETTWVIVFLAQLNLYFSAPTYTHFIWHSNCNKNVYTYYIRFYVVWSSSSLFLYIHIISPHTYTYILYSSYTIYNIISIFHIYVTSSVHVWTWFSLYSFSQYFINFNCFVLTQLLNPTLKLSNCRYLYIRMQYLKFVSWLEDNIYSNLLDIFKG